MKSGPGREASASATVRAAREASIVADRAGDLAACGKIVIADVIDPLADADEDGCLSRACGDYGEESMPMHGEYKEPGGKLVVVDLMVSGGRLNDVRVSGDFFLEPDSALDVINRALIGTRADAGVDAWASNVRSALGDGASLYGISAQGVAIAVERAVNGEAMP